MSKLYDEIYNAVKTIPKGRVATYGQVGAMVGNPKLARAVGNALHNNPLPGIIPCHRVVNVKGGLPENFAFGGAGRQRKLLEEEGIVFLDNGRVDMKRYGL